MRPSVAAALPGFTALFEGDVPYMYLDVRALVTCARGNLVDPLPLAEACRWQTPEGDSATYAQIEAAWCAVKARRDLCQDGGGGAFAHLTTLRLSPAEIDRLTVSRAQEDDATLAGGLANWAASPADAQLGALSMAWAVGAGGVLRGFPRFCAAYRVGDWGACGLECAIDATGNPGIVPRNRATVALFAAAAEPGDPNQVRGWAP